MAYVNIVNCLSIDWEEDKEVKKEVIEAKKKYFEIKILRNKNMLKHV